MSRQPPDLTTTFICRVCAVTRTGVRLGDMCPQDGHALLPETVYQEYIDDELLGEYLADKYAIVGFIGRGGLGTVYRAIQHPVRRTVAIKVIKPRLNEGLDLKRRFQREARAVARLEHPSVVTLYDYGFDEARDLLYMVMELCEGRELRAVLDADAPLQPARALNLLDQILSALQQAHGRGLVHRDLKPENLIIRETPEGELVKVLDFGIAKLNKTQEDEAATVLTRDGSILGTPAYLAPEQAMAREVESRTDLYAVGVIAFEMLTGNRPFTGKSAFQLLTAHCNAPVPPMPPELGVPPALELAIRKAMAKSIAGRYTDADAMAQALHDALEKGVGPEGQSSEVISNSTFALNATPAVVPGMLADTVQARGVSSAELVLPTRAAEPAKKSRVPLILAGLIGCLAVGGLVVGLSVPSGPTPNAAVLGAAVADAAVTQPADSAPKRPDAAPKPLDAAPKPVDAAPKPVDVAPKTTRVKVAERKKPPPKPHRLNARRTAKNNCKAQLTIISRASRGGSLAKGSGLCNKIMTLYRRDRAGRCEGGFVGLGGLEQFCQ